MSTGIVGGRAKAIVTGTGMNTALGAIQTDVQEADNDEDTPLQKKIGEFGNQLQVRAQGQLLRFARNRGLSCSSIAIRCFVKGVAA